MQTKLKVRMQQKQTASISLDELRKFGVSLISTYKENYLLKNTFRTKCENYILNVILSIGLGSIIGNLIFGYIGDIFGRKKVIVAAHFTEILGCLIIFITTLSAINKGTKTNNYWWGFCEC